MTRIQPQRICAKFNPPTLILVYSDQKYANKQRYKRFQIALFDNNVDVVVKKLVDENPLYLNSQLISIKQITTLVQKIVDKQLKYTPSIEDIPTPVTATVPSLSTQAPSNNGVVPFVQPADTLPSVAAEAVKSTTPEDKLFEINRITPDSANFVYDKQKQFTPNQPNDWDEEDLIDDEEDNVMF